YSELTEVARLTGPVERRAPIFVDGCRFARAHTSRQLKVTLPGPMTVADEVVAWGIETLEQAIDGLRAQTAVHICYGYGTPAVLAWKTKNTDWGHYGVTLPLLAKSRVDQVSVECAASGVDVAVLEELRGKDVLLGVVDVGTEDVESPETVADRLRRALPYVAPEHLKPCTDCGLVPRSREAAVGK